MTDSDKVKRLEEALERLKSATQSALGFLMNKKYDVEEIVDAVKRAEQTLKEIKNT